MASECLLCFVLRSVHTELLRHIWRAAPLIFDGHCDRQNGLHTHLPIKRYVDSDEVIWCWWAFIITAHKWSGGKVMFLCLCVILFTEGVHCPCMHHRSHDQGGSLSRGGLCPMGCLSRGSLPGGSLSRGSLSRGGLCPEGGSLSREGFC